MDLSIRRGNRRALLVYSRAASERFTVGLVAQSCQDLYGNAICPRIGYQHRRLLSRLTFRSSGPINRFAIDVAA